MPEEPARIELGEDELRAVAGYAAGQARRVLAVYAEHHPDDARPHDAVAAAAAFAAGGRRTNALRRAGWAAYRAGQEAGSPEATAAARAASHAAGAAFLHPLASPHQVEHVLGAAAQAARAEELATGTVVDLDRARDDAPPAVVVVLSRLPPAPAGRGRVRGLVRLLDAALRG